jgi:ATP-binding cassette subfamily C exporter for protease/lipase
LSDLGVQIGNRVERLALQAQISAHAHRVGGSRTTLGRSHR